MFRRCSATHLHLFHPRDVRRCWRKGAAGARSVAIVGFMGGWIAGGEAFLEGFQQGLTKGIHQGFPRLRGGIQAKQRGSIDHPVALCKSFSKVCKATAKGFPGEAGREISCLPAGLGELMALDDRVHPGPLRLPAGNRSSRRAVGRGITRACSTATGSCASARGPHGEDVLSTPA